MRLDAVAVALPSRSVTNDDVLHLICRQSQHVFKGDLERALRRIRHTLHHTGADTRRWLGPGETPIGLIAQALDGALEQAGCSRNEIDLVIYAGVDRGFLEPANAYLVAQALDLPRAECFDLLDACNGWSRAMRVAYGLFAAGEYRRIAIINAEFNLFEGGTIYPDLFRLESDEEIDFCLAAYTLGEAATVTLLSGAPAPEWEFLFSSRTNFADLCTVPVYAHERYCRASDRIAVKGRGRFASFGSELFAEATKEAMALFEQMRTPRDEIRVVFPHAASKSAWEGPARELGVGDRIYYVYPRCGNLVSASVPAGIALAIAEGRIRRGDRLVAWVASAGIACSITSFIY